MTEYAEVLYNAQSMESGAVTVAAAHDERYVTCQLKLTDLWVLTVDPRDALPCLTKMLQEYEQRAENAIQDVVYISTAIDALKARAT